jgi:hypothetical protein
MESHFDSHDGIIDGDESIPEFGEYVDFGGFWSDEYVLTLDTHIYEMNGVVDVEPKINNRSINEFCFLINAGSESDKSTGITPKDTVFREDTEA